ncbi:Arsenical resistance operon repressor [Photobacterium marinum]|uniref:Arsenical resistance operon repressor n=1 Tax=Photobacterium marinum TaxID=1056511 RepID=L8JC53_9GAMM|nr:transcriptional regulator [Photobacterium marinum]ELR65833.1 Arsenical resistance operon repressor [Photobacterium marinum]
MPCVTDLAVVEVDEVKEQALANAAKALAHPARIRILRILARQQGCLNSDLVSELGLAQSTVSEHLRILKVAGFVIAEPNPPRTCFSVDQARLDQFRELLSYL